MSKCTWEGCKDEATHPQIAKDGHVWANLCKHHNTEVEQALDAGEPKGILRAWIMAQGGSKKAALRMMEGA